MTQPRGHASRELIARYASNDPDIEADVVWALEVHLEGCGVCREFLGNAARATTMALVERVRTELAVEIARSPQPQRRKRFARLGARWATPVLAPWLGATVLVVLLAMVMDLVARSDGADVPSLMLLLAPVTPLLGVAAVWAQGRDPAHEVVAATPRAGLALVFRRTFAVLAVTGPVLTLAGLAVGASPALWLLPCLAFTAAALALGSVIGVPRAAAGLALLWAAVVVAPSIAAESTPVVLTTAAAPWWAVFTAVVTVVLFIRRVEFTRLRGER